MNRMVLSVRKYKVGYEVRKELWSEPFYGKPLEVRSAYTPAGDWIGDVKRAIYLVKKLGISPERADQKHCVCSIGFCKKDNKWYGWSHRALCGFGIGDKLFEEHYTDDDSCPYVQHGEITIETVEQAKQAAINFARSVS